MRGIIFVARASGIGYLLPGKATSIQNVEELPSGNTTAEIVML